jgi:hypothetical protein
MLGHEWQHIYIYSLQVKHDIHIFALPCMSTVFTYYIRPAAACHRSQAGIFGNWNSMQACMEPAAAAVDVDTFESTLFSGWGPVVLRLGREWWYYK